MSILIKGMEMPTYEQGDLVLRIRWDGRVDKDYSGNTVATAVPVQAHGRCIDADALMQIIREHDYPLRVHFNSTSNGMFTLGIQQAVDESPTIIPADEEEQK